MKANAGVWMDVAVVLLNGIYGVYFFRHLEAMDLEGYERLVSIGSGVLLILTLSAFPHVAGPPLARWLQLGGEAFVGLAGGATLGGLISGKMSTSLWVICANMLIWGLAIWVFVWWRWQRDVRRG